MFAVLENPSSPKPRLNLMLNIPKSFEAMAYFVRDPAKFVTKDNIGEAVFFGTLRGGDALHSLLQVTVGLLGISSGNMDRCCIDPEVLVDLQRRSAPVFCWS